LKFLKVRSYESAESACSAVWRMWFIPQSLGPRLAPRELQLLTNVDFVRGFVDAIAEAWLPSIGKKTSTKKLVRRQMQLKSLPNTVVSESPCVDLGGFVDEVQLGSAPGSTIVKRSPSP
jgi:hypothetical protein